jgi:CRP-like cAMP-binding protein
MQDVERGSLSHCKVLVGLEPDVVERLAAAATWRGYAVGEQLCVRGEPGTDLLFLCQGSARVLIHAASGQEVAFADINTGGHVGELSLVDGGARSATVVAAEPCVTASVPRSVMLEVVRNHAVVALNLLEDFARIMRGSNDRVVDLSTKSGVQRVYDELLRLMEPLPSGDGTWYIPMIPMHKEIAIWAGTTSDTVARAIGQLTSLGVVKRRNRSLHVVDRRHIEKLANIGETV